jgi:hypothetical protein
MAKVLDLAEGAGEVTQAMLDHAIERTGCQVMKPVDNGNVLAGTERDIVELIRFYPEHLQVAEVKRNPKKTQFLLAACPWVGRKHEGSHSYLVIHRDGGLGYVCFAGECQCNQEKSHFRELLFLLRSLTGRKHRLLNYYLDLDELFTMWGMVAQKVQDDVAPDGERSIAPPAPTSVEPLLILEPTAALATAPPEITAAAQLPLFAAAVAAPSPPPLIIDTADVSLSPAPHLPDRLYVDFETASTKDIGKVGLAQYCDHPPTRALMLAWSLNDGPRHEIDFTVTGEIFPPGVRAALTDPACQKVAWYCPFEVAIIGGLKQPHQRFGLVGLHLLLREFRDLVLGQHF